MMERYVAYYRVSTNKQGEHGLGMAAQQASVRAFVRDGKLIGEFTEVESGSRDDRPHLRQAIDLCREKQATLIIAKLDRLARDVHFISGLMKSDVKFIACDLPDAQPFQLHIFAAFAEEERRRISSRVKEALAQAKKRGVKLGGYRGTPPSPEAAAKGRASIHARRRNRSELIQTVLSEASLSEAVEQLKMSRRALRRHRRKALRQAILPGVAPKSDA